MNIQTPTVECQTNPVTAFKYIDRNALRTAYAVNFLKRMQPSGPWCLTAIVPDGDTVTRTFIPGEERELASFIGRYNGKRNVYFTVNEVSGKPTKKPNKEQISRAWFVHVDIDLPFLEDDTDAK